MNGMLLGFLIMMFAGALPCIALGYLVAVKQKRGLIAGWDASKISDPKAFAQWIGFSVFALGVAIGAIGCIWYLGWLNDIQMTVALCAVSLIPIPCLLIASAKYKKQDS